MARTVDDDPLIEECGFLPNMERVVWRGRAKIVKVEGRRLLVDADYVHTSGHGRRGSDSGVMDADAKRAATEFLTRVLSTALESKG